MILEMSYEDRDSRNISFLKQCLINDVENSNIHILCRTEAFKTYIETHCAPLIKAFIDEKLEANINILIAVDENLEIDDNYYNTNDSHDDFPSDKQQNLADRQSQSMNNDKANNHDSADSFDYYKYSRLNKNFTFDNFIRGTTNNYAVAASMNVAENPGKEFNPLYIYGGVGLGKTHIIQSIGNHFISKNPTAKVLYVDGSTFRDEFVYSITSKKKDFKNKYRSLDMFLLDDLQLLQTAQETSKELFDIFQTLYSQNKQMVFVSDKPPRELQNIEARLKNRFEQSLILLVEPPQFETRLAIIEKKLEGYNTTIATEIVEYIASNITTDIRKIEGAIKSYLSIRDIMNVVPTLEECIEQNIFKDYVTTSSSIKEMSVKSMIKAVAKYYGMTDHEILGQNRSKHIVRIRHITMYIAATYSGRSMTEIGLEFNKDHASIIFARNKIMELIKTDSHISNEITSLISSI